MAASTKVSRRIKGRDTGHKLFISSIYDLKLEKLAETFLVVHNIG
jgi:hypothetical protein